VFISADWLLMTVEVLSMSCMNIMEELLEIIEDFALVLSNCCLDIEHVNGTWCR